MRLLTIEQFAEVAQMHPETLRNMCRRRRLPGACKIGGTWRIDVDRFEAAVHADTIPEPPKRRHQQSDSRIEGWE